MHKYSKCTQSEQPNEYLYATHFEYILSTCAVVHTEIEYIILNIGTVRVKYATFTV